ncbi:MAG: hypothetical protein ACOVQ0_06665 [Novosphingobium sp.]|uniref:hypothetical protein n=1 Tax=Novosphingobium sp. TaxID=1874826 RepID=UPI003B9B8358
MPEDLATYYERRLQAEIEQIEARIKDLTQEKHALQRQLMKARQQGAGLADVNRKNSVNRIMIENRLIDALKTANGPLNAGQLLTAARYVNFELNENTFRTYLHRLKKQGIIKNAGRPGRWLLVNVHPPSTPVKAIS